MSKRTRKVFDKKSNKFKTYPRRNSRPLGKPTNDGSWYAPSPEIKKLAAAISMNNRNGMPVDYADGINLKSTNNNLNIMPGVAVNPIFHVPGLATRPNDPLNEATRANMNRIREEINATRAYEMPDLGKYIITICDFCAWYEFLKTIRKVCRKFNVLNAYTPTAILRGMLIDTSDINNLGIQLEFYINTLAKRMEYLKIPTDIQIVPTWIEDYKHIWVDEDIAKAQYIVNIPKYVWNYKIDPITGKSVLVPKMYAISSRLNNPYKVQDLIDFTEDLLSDFINDEDFAIMTGDIMKSYSNFYEPVGLNGDEIIEFEYSKEFLEKWHNSASFPNLDITGSNVNWTITEETSGNLDPYLVFNPTFTLPNETAFNSASRGAGNRMIDFYDPEVSDDQVVNACLWLWTFKTDRTNLSVSFKTINTSLIGGTYLWYFNNQRQLVHATYFGVVHATIESDGKEKFVYNNQIRDICLLSKWNYCPLTLMLVDSNATDSDDIGLSGILGDLGNYTILDSRILQNISTCIMYGQYNITKLLAG